MQEGWIIESLRLCFPSKQMGNHLTQSESEKPLLWAGKQCQQMLVWTDWWNHSEAGWNLCLIPREIESIVSANEQPGQWFTHWRRMSGSVRARLWVTLARCSPRQVQEGCRGTSSRGGRLPSLSASGETATFWSRGRKSLEGQITGFFLLALIVSKPLGTNDAMRGSFFTTLDCTVAIINLVIYDSNLQSLPWAIHLLFKKGDDKHCLKVYAHTIAPGKKLKYEAFPLSYS